VLVLVGLGLGFYLWPLTQTEVLPGKPGDIYYYLWQAKWFCPNFFAGKFRVTDFFWPGGVNLQGGYVAPLLYALTCPLYWLGPRVVIQAIYAMQVVVLLLVSVWTAGKYLKNDWLRVSFVFLYAFCGFYLVRIGEHVDLISTLWATALIFTLLDWWDVLSWKQTVVVAVAVAASFLCSWQNIANLTFLIVIMATAKLKSWKWVKEKWRKLVANLVVGVVVFIVCFLPLSWPMISYNLKQLGQAPPDDGVKTNMNLIQWVVPANQLREEFLPLLRQLNQRVSILETTNPVDMVIVIMGGAGVMYLIITGKLRPKRRDALLAVVYGLLPFGDNLSVNGEGMIALPYYRWLAAVPPLSLTRTPARLGVVLVFLVTLWTLVFVDWLLKSKKRWGWLERGAKLVAVYSVVSTTVLANNVQLSVFEDVKLFPMEALEQIRQAPTEVKVLDVPLSIGVYQVPDYLQLVHGHQIITGYVPYSTQTGETLKTIDSDLVLRQLECEGTSYKPSGMLVGKIGADEFGGAMKRNGIGYVIVHKAILRYPECARVKEIVDGVVDDQRLRLLSSKTDFWIYQIVDDNSPDPYLH